MTVSDRKSWRDTAPVRPLLALLGVGLVLVASLLVIWRVDPWGKGAFVIDPRSPAASEAVQALSPADATLAEIAAIRDDFARNAALYRLGKDATKVQLVNWLAALETLPKSPHRYDVARVLYIRFAVLDPEAALDNALQGATKPAWLEAIFRIWVQIDTDAAIARATTLHASAKAAASRALLQLGLRRPIRARSPNGWTRPWTVTGIAASKRSKGSPCPCPPCVCWLKLKPAGSRGARASHTPAPGTARSD